MKNVSNFPDYFKSELMETKRPDQYQDRNLRSFPDYFKSELMETLGCQISYILQLSRLLQIGINGNIFFFLRILKHAYPFPITSNRN